QVWYNIIGEYADQIRSDAAYPSNDNVISGNVCQRTGNIATANCPTAGTGYWKSSNAPVCDGCWKYTTAATTATTEAAQSTTVYTETAAPTQAPTDAPAA
ncbi:MAG: hypothetical protein IJY74_02190, partial [Oscillospiraceae bacterium]|nr:hypothetical protein [Oscillospiraceae bacterium]